MVCHLVTAADGAEEYYTNETNEARYESPEQAREMDKKLVNAWTGHAHLFIIGNRDDGFSGKMNRMANAIMKYIGLPSPSNLYKKFLLQTDESGNFLFDAPDIKFEEFNVEEHFLQTTGNELEVKVRSRGRGDSHTYVYERRTETHGERITKK